MNYSNNNGISNPYQTLNNRLDRIRGTLNQIEQKNKEIKELTIKANQILSQLYIQVNPEDRAIAEEILNADLIKDLL